MPESFFIRKIGFVNTNGKDVIDFLNRMSTNDFRKFSNFDFRKTVLTNDKGRIIDLINVLAIESSPIILTSEISRNKVISHLEKYIIMDDVRLKGSDEIYFHIEIFSEGDVIELAKIMFDVELQKGKFTVYGGSDYIYTDDFKVNTLNVICMEERVNFFKNILHKFRELNKTDYEKLRIVSGIPEGESEFNDQINPVECGLSRFISFTKGCYIGQEVIARLDSQGKIPKQMVQLKSESKLESGEKIFDEDLKESGFVSTALNLGSDNMGLGFIRSVNLNFEKKYFTQLNGEKKIISISKIN